LVNQQQETVAEGVANPEYTYQAQDAEDEQVFMQYAVFALDREGRASEGAVSRALAVGAPYGLPLRESFANGMLTHEMAMESDGAVWWAATDAEYPEVDSQDGDNGFAVMSANNLEEGARLITGLLDLSGAVEPRLSFWYFCLDNTDENTLAVSVDDGNGVLPLGEALSMGKGERRTWMRTVMPLTDYAGKQVQLQFEGLILKYSLLMLDNIEVDDAAAGMESLAGGEVEAEVRVAGGELVVDASEGVPVMVADMAGRVVATGRGGLRVSLPVGIYVVKAGDFRRVISVD
jgi:hypothetical protein